VGLLGRIFAHDADAPGPNSEIDYELTNLATGGENRFSIDGHGRISLKEGGEPLKPGEEATFTVVARDRGSSLRLESNASVTLIALGRANKFTLSNRKPRLLEFAMWRELYVSDSDNVGTIVGMVKAVDEDNDPLWWNIVDEGDSDANNFNAIQTFGFRGSSGELVSGRTYV
jgi:hypothetical protein